MGVPIWSCIPDEVKAQLEKYQEKTHGGRLHEPVRKPEVEEDIARIMSERPKTDFHEVGR